MSAQIICSGLAQAALWATSMPTITAGMHALAFPGFGYAASSLRISELTPVAKPGD